MANKPFKSSDFDELNARDFGRGDGDDSEFGGDADHFLADDRDPAEVAAAVDLSESDLDKAITAGFGPERDDDEESESEREGKDERTSQRGARDDDASFSKRTRKRIERERRVTARERQDRINAERERDELRARLEAVEKKTSDQDLAALDTEIQRHETELTDLEKALAKASEDHEHEEIAKITRRMQDASARRIAAAQRKESAEQQRKRASEGGGADRPLDPLAKQFMDANADWWNDPKRAIDKATIIAIDEAVHRQGFKVNTEEYYVEIARQAKERGLAIELPEFIREEDLEEEEEGEDDRRDTRRRDTNTRNRREPQRGRQQGRRGPGGMGSGGGRGEDRRLRDEAAGKVVLSQADMEKMRRFRLDPNNKVHVREFARQRQESAQRELRSRE